MAKINQIREDMSYNQVVSILGPPDRPAAGLRPTWKVNGSTLNQIGVYFTDDAVFRIKWMKIGSFIYTIDFLDSYVFSGPGTDSDIDKLKRRWGVDLPGGEPVLIKNFDDLMVYMVGHERLDEIKAQKRMEWAPVESGRIIEHENFVVSGENDPKVIVSEWADENGLNLIICLDYSTGFASFFAFGN